jgi:hypothetical protein
MPGNPRPRFIEVQVYTPHNCRKYDLRFHCDILEVRAADGK